MAFLHYAAMLLAMVAVCLGLYFLLKTLYTRSEKADSCPAFYSTCNASFAEFAGSSPYFVKYYASDNETTYPAYSSKDGHKMSLTRVGNTDDYAFNITTIDNEQNKYEANTVYTVDEKARRVKKYGVWQNFQIMSFKMGAYALVYFCIPNEKGHELYRALMTTSLGNNLTEPILEDKKHNFSHPLFELPYKYENLYSS